MTEPRIAPSDVQELLERISAITTTHGDAGITRLGYSKLERDAHKIFAAEMHALGLNVSTDAAGNTIAEFIPTGVALDAPGFGTGSHLDSVPHGGRYDGVVGVVGAILAARLLVAQPHGLCHPIRFLVFANEEGARFGQACNGSRALAGKISADDLEHLVDKDGVTAASAMRQVGLHPELVHQARLRSTRWLGFLELHIEQGSILAKRNMDIGIVDTISGSTRFAGTVHGIPTHSGGTPMNHRADALVTAARIVVAARDLATDPRHHGTRITIGRLDVTPDSMTTIPGRVDFAADIRDIDADRQRSTANELVATAQQLAEADSTTLETHLISDATPTVLPESILSRSLQATRELGYSHITMASGASHDSQMMNHVCPAGMIFVPSQHGGISHAPEEFSTAEDIAHGIDVLVSTLRLLSKDAACQKVNS